MTSETNSIFHFIFSITQQITFTKLITDFNIFYTWK